MSQRQEQLSDNLPRTIQRIHIEARTGYLRVARGDGTNQENGLLRFLGGKVVAARVGREQGNKALTILLTWERCFFVFYPSDEQGNIQESPSEREQPYRQESPSEREQSYRQESPSEREQPYRREQDTQPLGQKTFNTNPSMPVVKRGIEPSAPIPLKAVPRATMSIMKAITLAEKSGLPQLCRPIILAIDGRATVGELIARVGCTPEEMYSALTSMERLAIIRFIR